MRYLRGIQALLIALLLPVFGKVQADRAVDTAADERRVPMVIEGDILVASSVGQQMRSLALQASTRLWSDGIVPYRLDAGLSAAGIEAVMQAVTFWNRVSGITLRSLDEWPSSQPLPADSVLFQPGEGCASWVGRRGGVQEVWVAPNCNAGSMMHEIGHLLGLEHEHTRPDRDQHIAIHWQNIDPEKHHNFDAAPATTRMLGDYDYGSIMHYGPMNFSVNGQPTISPLVKTEATMGQRIAPSAGDLSAVAQLYAADLSVVTGFATVSGNSEVSVHVSNTRAQGAHDITVNVRFGDSVLLAFSGEGWECRRADIGLASCTLARLSGGDSQVVVLTVSGTLSAAEITAVVSSKTPDEYPGNNADGAGEVPRQAAASALEDPAVTQLSTTTVTELGAVSWMWFAVAGLLLHRLSGGRVYRQSGYRIE